MKSLVPNWSCYLNCELLNGTTLTFQGAGVLNIVNIMVVIMSFNQNSFLMEVSSLPKEITHINKT